MESRWFLKEGQSLQNTKIRDRSLALHVSAGVWDQFHGHLKRNEASEAEIKRQDDRRRFLKEKSEAMTRNWENSVENIRKRQDEDRRKSLEAQKEERMRRYLELRKERDDIRKQYLDGVKKKIFMTTGHQKEVTSALITSEVLFERTKQLEFKGMLKRHLAEEEAAYAARVKQAAADEVKEREFKEKEIREKIYRHGTELRNDIEERKKSEEDARNSKVRKELEDIEKATKEMKILKKLEEDEKRFKKTQALREKRRNLEEERENQRKEQQEEQEMQLYADIRRDADRALLCERREREKKFREDLVEKRAEIGNFMRAQDEAKLQEEERILKNAIAEKEKINENVIHAKLEHVNMLKEERLRDRKAYLDGECEKQQRDTHVKQWEMLNRFESAKAIDNYNENQLRSNWENVLKYRSELQEQIDERKDFLKAEKRLEDELDMKNFDEEDSKFMAYANEVKQHAEKGGRNTYPIEKVILEYKKTNRLQR